MRFGKSLIAAVVASSLIAAPAVAGSQNLSVASAQRDAAPVGQEENLVFTAIIPVIMALSMVLAVVVTAVADNNEDAPTSP